MARPRERFLIIGGGKMGEAILKGWIASESSPADAIAPDDIEVVNPGEERRSHLMRTYGVKCFADAAEANGVFDVVVLAVKPQVMMGVLEHLSALDSICGGSQGNGPLFVSIAAGLTTDALAAALPEGAPVVRVMPNMPLAIGAGASGVCGGASAAPEQVEHVAALFGCLGRAVVVDERDMDAVCAISGSGPAYVAAMVEALRDAGQAEGLDPALAEALALQTVLGTARLIDETGVSPAEARESICSPGGTTLAALDAMRAAGFERVFADGVRAAVVRSEELARCI